MIAAVDEEIAARVRELTLFDVLHPCSVDTNGYVVFCFARYRTRMATDTLALVDYESVLCHECFLPTRQKRNVFLATSVWEKQAFV